MDVSIEIDGVKQVVASFDKKNQKASNLRPAMSTIGGQMMKSTDLNYASIGSRFGKRWATRRRTYNWPILQKTGAMRNNFKSEVGNDWVKVFNSVKYFPFHQRGTTKLPQRAMLGYTTSDINEVVRTLRRHMEIGNG
jgi:phage gpG-like protein